MRPTRWTKKRRATYYGKGGWSLDWRRGYASYTNPVTGHSVCCLPSAAHGSFPIALINTLRMRRKQERRKKQQAKAAARWRHA